jgi:hypothetical protein
MAYTAIVPSGRYPINVTRRDLADLKEAILGVAPEALDTLQELAAAIGDDPAFFTTIANQVSELNTDVTDVVAALGVAENDTDVGTFSSPTLPDGTTLRAVLEAFAGAYDTTKSNLESADTALSGRIDTLEADPTTAAAVAAVQADVDQNELDSDAAEAALSGRLDVLEADPTTATALAAGDAATLSSANAYTDGEITTLINGAPGVLDTLKELSDSLGGDADFVTTINASIAAVQADVDTNESDSDSADSALSGRLDVLEADPTTATALAAVQADVDANETASDNAEAALSGRLDTLEADPTTQTIVDGINTALDARLDTLEADPTTATAVAAVQADVDQNESDADAAIALKLNTANPAATGVLTVDTNARLQFDSNLTKVENVLRGTGINIGNNIEMRPAAAGGRVEITGDLLLDASDLVNANNDTDAANGGTPVGGIYHHNGAVRIRLV